MRFALDDLDVFFPYDSLYPEQFARVRPARGHFRDGASQDRPYAGTCAS